MRALKKLLAVAALCGAVGACYVETYHRPYYAYPTCRPGYVWDGYRCRYHYHY
jgi:hypothetical protein